MVILRVPAWKVWEPLPYSAWMRCYDSHLYFPDKNRLWWQRTLIPGLVQWMLKHRHFSPLIPSIDQSHHAPSEWHTNLTTMKCDHLEADRQCKNTAMNCDKIERLNLYALCWHIGKDFLLLVFIKLNITFHNILCFSPLV